MLLSCINGTNETETVQDNQVQERQSLFAYYIKEESPDMWKPIKKGNTGPNIDNMEVYVRGNFSRISTSGGEEK